MAKAKRRERHSAVWTNLTVVAVDQERNLILVKGSVPGHRNGVVYIRPSR